MDSKFNNFIHKHQYWINGMTTMLKLACLTTRQLCYVVERFLISQGSARLTKCKKVNHSKVLSTLTMSYFLDHNGCHMEVLSH